MCSWDQILSSISIGPNWDKRHEINSITERFYDNDYYSTIAEISFWFSSLTALEVVKTTSFSTASDKISSKWRQFRFSECTYIFSIAAQYSVWWDSRLHGVYSLLSISLMLCFSTLSRSLIWGHYRRLYLITKQIRTGRYVECWLGPPLPVCIRISFGFVYWLINNRRKSWRAGTSYPLIWNFQI